MYVLLELARVAAVAQAIASPPRQPRWRQRRLVRLRRWPRLCRLARRPRWRQRRLVRLSPRLRRLPRPRQPRWRQRRLMRLRRSPCLRRLGRRPRWGCNAASCGCSLGPARVAAARGLGAPRTAAACRLGATANSRHRSSWLLRPSASRIAAACSLGATHADADDGLGAARGSGGPPRNRNVTATYLASLEISSEMKFHEIS